MLEGKEPSTAPPALIEVFANVFPGLTHPSGKAAGAPGPAWAKSGLRPYRPIVVAGMAFDCP
jgi:hypothetical protein